MTIPALSTPIEDTPPHVIALHAAHDARQRGLTRMAERWEEEARRLAPALPSPGPVAICWEHCGDATPVRLSFTVLCF